MKKLDPDQLVVTSFPTSEPQQSSISRTTALGEPQLTTHPTDMTFCFWCPPPTMDCF